MNPRPIPPKSKRYFDQFVALANKQVPHPLDWQRFYRFVRACQAWRARLNERDVKEHLVRAGFSKIVAAQLSTAYDHGIETLRTPVPTGRPRTYE